MDQSVVKLKEVIRLEKVVSDYGQWKEGEIDRAAWPLRKKKLKFSLDWHWRVVMLEADGRRLRVLLRLNLLLEQFYAILGEVRGDSIVVLCSHDLHTTHSNWHCHTAIGDIDKVISGVWRDSNSFRYWPSYTGPCSIAFDVTKESALGIACDLYRFPSPRQGDLFA